MNSDGEDPEWAGECRGLEQSGHLRVRHGAQREGQEAPTRAGLFSYLQYITVQVICFQIFSRSEKSFRSFSQFGVQEAKAEEERRRQQETEQDYLGPFVARRGNPDTLFITQKLAFDIREDALNVSIERF